MATAKSMLQRLRERLRRARDDTDSLSGLEGHAAGMPDSDTGRRKTELDENGTPVVDISKSGSPAYARALAQAQAKAKPGVTKQVTKTIVSRGAKAVLADRVAERAASSRETLQAQGQPGAGIYSAPAPAARPTADDQGPPMVLGGYSALGHSPVVNARPAPAKAPRREFSLATPSLFGDPAHDSSPRGESDGSEPGLTGGTDLSPLREDDGPTRDQPRSRMSSQEALLGLLLSGPGLSTSSGFTGDHAHSSVDTRGPYLTGASPLGSPRSQEPVSTVARRNFSLSTPPPFDPPPGQLPDAVPAGGAGLAVHTDLRTNTDAPPGSSGFSPFAHDASLTAHVQPGTDSWGAAPLVHQPSSTSHGLYGSHAAGFSPFAHQSLPTTGAPLGSGFSGTSNLFGSTSQDTSGGGWFSTDSGGFDPPPTLTPRGD